MKWIVVVLSCLFTAAANAAAPKELTGREYSETLLLLSQSDFEVRLAAKSLYRLGASRQSIPDLAAEITWAACSGNRKMHLDGQAWLAKALGSTKQARYAELLDYCLANTTDKKLIKYLTEAKAGLEGTTTDSFVGGKLDLEQMRASLTKKGGPAPGMQATRQFDALRQGQPLDEIYSALGRPDELNGLNVTGSRVGHIVRVRTSEDMIVFGYDGLGTARFFYDETKTNWVLADAKSDRGLLWINGSGRFGTLEDMITTGDNGDLREVLKRLRKRDSVERATLDRVADRIYQSRLDPDDDMADTLAWLCKVLGDSGDGRYKQFLIDMSNTAGDKAVRKHAGKASDRLPDTTEEKYVPSLAGK